MRTALATVTLAVILLTTASRSEAFVVGDDLTGLPQINQALDDARAYWQGRRPACPAGVRVTVADLSSEREAANARDCALTLDLGWLDSGPDRTRYCALFSHEYGHLLGYGHELYPEDREHVMTDRGTPTYCRTFGVHTMKLPKPCQWPEWARAAPAVRKLYAAGRRDAAKVLFRKWRKRHPKAPLGPCVAT